MRELLSDSDYHQILGNHTFQAKRQTYFARLALKNRNLYALHQVSGQTNRSVRYGRTEQGQAKRWGDPTQHCLVEAAASLVLSDMIDLSDRDKADFFTAAFVHDAGKKREVKELRGVTDPMAVEVSYAKSKALLKAYGVPSRAVRLTETVAHTSLPQFAELNPDNEIVLRPRLRHVDMAMHHLDDCTRGSELVTFDERIDYLDSVAATRYPYNEEGRAVWGDRTFFEAQREVGHLVEARLAQLAGIQNPPDLPLVIRDQLIDNIMQS